jgi:hypothetical protein
MMATARLIPGLAAPSWQHLADHRPIVGARYAVHAFYVVHVVHRVGEMVN